MRSGRHDNAAVGPVTMAGQQAVDGDVLVQPYPVDATPSQPENSASWQPFTVARGRKNAGRGRSTRAGQAPPRRAWPDGGHSHNKPARTRDDRRQGSHLRFACTTVTARQRCTVMVGSPVRPVADRAESAGGHRPKGAGGPHEFTAWNRSFEVGSSCSYRGCDPVSPLGRPRASIAPSCVYL